MEPKVIIFDGPDNVGKTTQIKMLMKHLIDRPTYVNYFPNIVGISNEQSFEYNKMLYEDMFLLMGQSLIVKRNLIFDRSYLSEFVYGKLYRDQEPRYVFNIEVNGYCQIDTKNMFNVFLIVLIDDYKNLIKREDGNSFSIDENLKRKEVNLFKKAYKESYIDNKILIDTKNKTIEKVNQKILKFLGIEDVKTNK
jgi:thymidylate kinase